MSVLSGTRIFYAFGIVFVLVGVAIVLLATILAFISRTKGKNNVKAGGVIVIGFIPIVFGSDKESVRKILLLSIALMTILVIMIIAYYLVAR